MLATVNRMVNIATVDGSVHIATVDRSLHIDSVDRPLYIATVDRPFHILVFTVDWALHVACKKCLSMGSAAVVLLLFEAI